MEPQSSEGSTRKIQEVYNDEVIEFSNLDGASKKAKTDRET